ncbi:hypothetical protein FF100_19970 [Methylobacterium terricola]|uniref:OmpA-like domain-containing protein n=1 Tax=Methylobacterium terricola TaxID=2583531 RepID=A0A5C4LGE2_9HYPH|nr:OmpA family protein [Methylobacterium terricola]TNC11401.1 hypothetical protein FF100_19970 [Methylobacterium terricola]
MGAAATEGPAEDLAFRDLKRLLLRDEHRDLAGLRDELARLDRRVGSEDRFSRAVADSLVVALKVVEVENHRALTEVIAPLVVAGIRREIAESRDLMVETLYPIAGRMVTAAIAAAFRQLSDEINETLSRTPRRLWLRLKALLTGQSYAALVLAELVQGRLERLILIDRGTGAVLATTDRDGRPDADPDGQLHLIGGLVTAIVEFAGQALSDVNGELRSLDFGGRTVLLRASPLLIVAGLTEAGRGAGRLAARVDAEFLPFLDAVRQGEEQRDGAGHAAPLAALHRAIAARLAPPQRRRLRPVAVAGGLVAALLAAWATTAIASARQRAAEAAALARIEDAPDWRDAPLRLAFDREAGVIRATGVLPTREAAASLRGRLAAAFPGWPVVARIAVASDADPGREAVATLDRRTEALTGRTEAVARQTEALAHRAEALSDRTAATARQTEALALRTDALTARAETAARQGDRLDARTDAVARQAATLTARTEALTGRTDALARRTEATEAMAGEATARLATLETRTAAVEAVVPSLAPRAEVARLEARTDTPLHRLEDAAMRTAIFFGPDAAYRDPERAERDLATLASALAAVEGARLRIVGYADGTGTPRANLEAARLRADRITADLERRGIPRTRLVVVNSRPPFPITEERVTGNRRVVFELAYGAE